MAESAAGFGRVGWLGVAVVLSGCRGKELARAELRAPGVAEARFTAGAVAPSLWADLDGKWKGRQRSRLPVGYSVEVSQKGKMLGVIACSANEGVTAVCGSSVTIGSSRSEDCEVKMKCALPPLTPGEEVVLRVTGRAQGGPIEKIANMSLVVREEKP